MFLRSPCFAKGNILGIALLVWALATPDGAGAVTITVENPGFEQDAVSDYRYTGTSFPIVGWEANYQWTDILALAEYGKTFQPAPSESAVIKYKEGKRGYVQQTISGLTVDESYRVRFYAAHRNTENNCPFIGVYLDGVLAARGKIALSQATSAGFGMYDVFFIAKSTSAVLRFESAGPRPGSTIFLDAVSVESGTDPNPPESSASLITNGGFEEDTLCGSNFEYTGASSTIAGWEANYQWTDILALSVYGPSSAFQPAPSGEGSQFAVIKYKEGKRGYVQQTISGLTVDESYRVRFYAAHRNTENNCPFIGVYLDGVLAARGKIALSQATSAGFGMYDVFFIAKSTSAVLRFESAGPRPGSTIFLDAVSVESGTDPNPPETDTSLIKNSGFEEDTLCGSSYKYTFQNGGPTADFPAGSPLQWTAGGGDVAIAATGQNTFNPSSAIGGSFLVLKSGAFVEQTITNLVPYQSYRVSFLTASRDNERGNAHISVIVDGEVVLGEVDLTTATLFRMHTAYFTAAGSSVVLRFQNPATSASTIFLDELTVEVAAAPPPLPEAGGEGYLKNPSFEADDLGTKDFQYLLLPQSWQAEGARDETVTSGNVVLAANGNSPFGSLNSRAGKNYLVIRDEASIFQNMTGLTPGKTYVVSFLAASRPFGDLQKKELQVLIAGAVVVPTFTPNTAFDSYSATFTATDSIAELRFRHPSAGPSSGNEVFVDGIRIVGPGRCVGTHDFERAGECWRIFNTEHATQAAAAAQCQGWGGELATILDDDVNDAIQRKAHAKGWAGTKTMWIGARRRQDTLRRSNPDWRWPLGTQMDYDNWAGAEPSNEDCSRMLSDGEWEAVPCAGESSTAVACVKPSMPCDVVASGYCYLIRDGPKSRLDASNWCSGWGGTLATIPDATAEGAVNYELEQRGIADPAWVGLKRSQQLDYWVWDDEVNPSLIVLNWKSGEPGATSCAKIDPAAEGRLEGVLCSSTSDSDAPYVCSQPLLAPCSGAQVRYGTSGRIGDRHSIPNQECSWLIQPAVPNVLTISLEFEVFDLEKGRDMVKVYDGNDNLVADLTGTLDPETDIGFITVNTPSLRIVFTTDWQVQNADGFSAVWRTGVPYNCSDDSWCDTNSECEPLLDGAMQCTCNDGYQGNGLDPALGGEGCGDVNECESDLIAYPCDDVSRASCNNNVGGYTCLCHEGYEGNPYAGGGCTLINPCLDDPGHCVGMAACNYKGDGAYNCSCPAGYEGDGETAGNGCSNIDECATVPGPCDANADCEDTEPGFDCKCRSGFMGEGLTCTDIDECVRQVDLCDDTHGQCHNIPGGYWCNCSEGYTTASDLDPSQDTGNGTTCYDADECAFGYHNCDADAICTNNAGSFTCACPSGFVGDGFDCVELCSEVESDQCHTWAFCGDAVCTCPEGLVGSGYGATGCIRTSWAVIFNIRLPWLTQSDVVGNQKLASWAEYQPAYISLLTASPPAGFATSMFHEVELDTGNSAGGLITIAALFAVEGDAETARAALQTHLDAETPPTVFGVSLTATQTLLTPRPPARRDLDDDLLINGTYPVEPRVYAWTNPSTSGPIQVKPTGMDVQAVYFEPSCKQTGCWVVDVFYTTGEDNFKVFYLPNAETTSDTNSFDFDYNVQMDSVYAMTAEETFLPKNFPCRTHDYVPDVNSNIPSKVTACCIPEFLALYRPVSSFESAMLSVVTKASCDQGNQVYFLPATFIETDPLISYVQKPVNAIAGTFSGMTYSEVVFKGVLDPYFRQYSATFYLDEVELRQKAGMLRGTVGVEHTIDTFVGISNFKPTGIAFLDPFAMQVNIHLEKTSFFSVSTHGVNQYTFLEYVNMRLVMILNEDTVFSGVDESLDRTVRTNRTGNAAYVQVTFTMGEQYSPNLDSGGLIPLDSVRAGRGTFFSSTQLEHLCSMYDDDTEPSIGLTGLTNTKTVFDGLIQQDCAPQTEMCSSPDSVPDQFVAFNIPLGFEVFDNQASNTLSNNIFVDMVVNALESDAGPNPNEGDAPMQMKTTLSASIPIVDGGVNIFCDGITGKTDLRDVADVDVIVGSAWNASELTRLRIVKDIASTQLRPENIAEIDSDSIEAGLMTLVVKGNASFFASNSGINSRGVSIELEDLITLHIMEDSGRGENADKVSEVMALLEQAPDDNTLADGIDTDGYALNGAFGFTVDRVAQRAHLEPSTDLLEICPFNPTRPTGIELETCVTRRDVRWRNYPKRSGAVSTAMELCANLAGNMGSECSGVEACCPALDATASNEANFFTTILGANDYARELGVRFARTVAASYDLNGRYRRAYWINPGYEWTPTQTGGASRFSISQKFFLFALITLDEGVASAPGTTHPQGAGPFFSRRRMLLSTADSLKDAQSAVSGQAFQYQTSFESMMSRAFEVPVDRVATFSVKLQLTQAQACMAAPGLQESIRLALDDAVQGAISPYHTLQLLAEAFSAATADVTMLVVFEEGTVSEIDLEKIAAQGAGIQAIEPVSVSAKVDTSGPTTPYENPGPSKDDGGSSNNPAMIAGVVAGVVGGSALLAAGVLYMRRRFAPEAQEAVFVQTTQLQDLKAQLADDL